MCYRKREHEERDVRIRIDVNKGPRYRSHVWFAWHPVVAEDSDGCRHLVWLENVSRTMYVSKNKDMYRYKVIND